MIVVGLFVVTIVMVALAAIEWRRTRHGLEARQGSSLLPRADPLRRRTVRRA
jgi:hypothetical protein